jgi:histidinol dehydrogenase
MSFNTIIDWNGCSADQQQQLLTRPAISASESISKTVAEILITSKPTATRRCANTARSLIKPRRRAAGDEAEIAAAGERLSDELKQAMAVAVKNIETFHNAQQLQAVDVETLPGALPAGHPPYRLRRAVYSRRLGAAVLHGADAGDAGAHRRLSAGGALLAAADCR